jgi:hypothetical protein
VLARHNTKRENQISRIDLDRILRGHSMLRRHRYTQDGAQRAKQLDFLWQERHLQKRRQLGKKIPAQRPS